MRRNMRKRLSKEFNNMHRFWSKDSRLRTWRLSLHKAPDVTADNETIAEIWPSYYWPKDAVVIVTACGHKHVRPKTPEVHIGDPFLCPFCLDTSDDKAPN